MRVLVTGSSGRIGRAILVRLALEHEVLGLDRSPSSTAHICGDVASADVARRALFGVDAIIHTAALHAPQVGLVKESEFRRINVQATRMLAEMAADAGIQSFIFTSTTALYGHAVTAASKASWLDEGLVPEPRTIYHETKIEAEALLEDIAETTGLSVVALRMSRCFPEPAPVMAAYRLHRGVDARDVADAHACALVKGYPGFRKYVISGASPFHVEDAALLHENALAVIQDREPLLAEAFVQRGWRLPETIDRVCDPSRAMTELGWVPRFGFKEVLRMLDEQSSEVLPP